MTRATQDQYFMLLAEQAAKRSTCSRLHVGAIVMQYGQVKSTGYNGAPRGVSHCVHNDDSPCRLSVHAEVNALLQMSHVYPDMPLVMYVTHAPCFDCAKLMLNARITEVVYGDVYRSMEGVLLLKEQNVKVRQEGVSHV